MPEVEFKTHEDLQKSLVAVNKGLSSVESADKINSETNDLSRYQLGPDETEMNLIKRVALMKACMANPMKLEKSSLNVAGGLTWYDLRAPALHLIPWLTPLRDRLPRIMKTDAGTAQNWKVIDPSVVLNGGFNADPWINEGARAPLFSFSATSKLASYITIGNDGSVTFEAESASQGMEDANSLARFLGLELLMVKEEDALIGGNATLKLGTANTPTVTDGGAATGGTITGATYSVIVVGLSYAGYRNNPVTAGQLIQQKTITTPDGKVMTVNGGMGQKSANGSAAITTNHYLNATVVQKSGEIAWAWYVGAAGSEKLEAITFVPSLSLATLAGTGQLASALTAADYSVNDGTTGSGTNQVTAFDGIITQVWNAAIAGKAIVTKLAGATLTSTGRGSVAEIDAIIQAQWDTYRVSATYMLVNSQQLKDLTSKVLNGSSAPLLRYEMTADGDQYKLTASGTIAYYFSPFLPDGGQKIPIIVHPTVPAGTIILGCDRLPSYFKSNNTPTIAEVLCRRDYYSIDWALRTREREFGVYAEEVLALYAPFSFALLTGIGNG